MKYICDICGKEFESKRSLANHRRWHDLSEYKEFQEKFRKKISETTKWKKGVKVCNQCGIPKTREEYYKMRGKIYEGKCKKCSLKDRENRRLKKIYGITLEDYNKILKRQNNRCLICGSLKNSGWGKFHVDHNHKTKKIRGLLCSNCNTAIGLTGENIFVLFKMIKYLKGEEK